MCVHRIDDYDCIIAAEESFRAWMDGWMDVCMYVCMYRMWDLRRSTCDEREVLDRVALYPFFFDGESERGYGVLISKGRVMWFFYFIRRPNEMV